MFWAIELLQDLLSSAAHLLHGQKKKKKMYFSITHSLLEHHIAGNNKLAFKSFQSVFFFFLSLLFFTRQMTAAAQTRGSAGSSPQSPAGGWLQLALPSSPTRMFKIRRVWCKLDVQMPSEERLEDFWR